MTHVLYEDFTGPFIDIDEWRDAPVRHRYVHGGFSSNGTRFSFYLAPTEQYQGRFFQHFTPVPDSENLAQSATGQEDRIGFAIASGAYFVETNGGGQVSVPGGGGDPTYSAFRANAACAEYSRTVAREMYGEHHVYGYAYGGSGGAYRTIAAAENTDGVWDGFVPYVPGSPMAIPNVFCVRMHAMRVLRDKLDGIVDALDAGGSGDALAGLNDEERAAFAEVTCMGFPPRSWFAHRTMGVHAFAVLYPHVALIDPGYFEEFWTTSGYLGADPASSVHRDRVRLTARVEQVLSVPEALALGLQLPSGAGNARGGVDNAFAGPSKADSIAALRLDVELPATMQGAVLTARSGERAGTAYNLKSAQGALIVFDEQAIGTVPTGIAVGDEVSIDNSNFLAAQTYHRHQVPGPDYPVWDQFRDDDGEPIYPQRPMVIGPMFALGATGVLQTAKFNGRMIVVSCLLDREAFPWQADWYRQKVREHLGADTDSRYRLWFIDNALHGDSEQQEFPAHTVSYLGALHQALRDLADWVERGVDPAATTAYEVFDGQVVVPEEAAARLGVQPVLAVTVNGADRAEVGAGAVVTVGVEATVPPRAGEIMRLEWDLDGDGVFELVDEIEALDAVQGERQTSFTEPGTHMVTVRVSAQREGDPDTSFARIDNLARARVVVA